MDHFKLSEELSNLNYSSKHLEAVPDEDHTYILKASGEAGLVHFNLRCKVYMHGHVLKTLDLHVSLLDPLDKLEIHKWVRACERRADAQTFLKGVAEYGELSTTRRNILDVCRSVGATHFSIRRFQDDGSFKVRAWEPVMGLTLFEVNWVISWDDVRHRMRTDFEFDIHTQGEALVKKSGNSLQRLCNAGSKLTPQDLWDGWKEIFQAVLGITGENLNKELQKYVQQGFHVKE